MPGAGVSAQNIASLRALTGAREFHASAKLELPSRMRGGNTLPGMTAGEVLSDIEQVRALVAALNRVAGG
jgi:copper homeostasis protein